MTFYPARWAELFPITQEELIHLHRRRLTQQLWKDFSPTKRSMEWYKHNTPTTSPFVYYSPHQSTTTFSTGFSTEFSTIQKH